MTFGIFCNTAFTFRTVCSEAGFHSCVVTHSASSAHGFVYKERPLSSASLACLYSTCFSSPPFLTHTLTLREPTRRESQRRASTEVQYTDVHGP
jgi:hypothetical protein